MFRNIRLSPNFLLSDFMGNHSVYARGLPNVYPDAETDGERYSLVTRNGRALCENVLEPILERFGPISISYGYISPDFSRATVKYQDPNLPSHHRWDLGAAADIIVHSYVQGRSTPDMRQLFENENTRTSPASLAHVLDEMRLPYSRMITYSESAGICVAVSADEVERHQPRKAFYENRYQGIPGGKPKYVSQPSKGAREKTSAWLQEEGLEHPWQGQGYPSYHGGGLRQLHHIRVSKYTMVSDYLFNLRSISEGHKCAPNLSSPEVMDAFAAAGFVYDKIIDTLEVGRLSIVGFRIGNAEGRDSNLIFCVDSERLGRFQTLINDIRDVSCAVRSTFDLFNAFNRELYSTTTSILIVEFCIEDVLNGTDWTT